MKTKKSYIDTYSTVYYMDLVVANAAVKLEDLQKLYTYADGVELDEQILNGSCTTSTVKRRSDGMYCCLVKYNHQLAIKSLDKRVELVNTCAHEAAHVALDIYQSISETVCMDHQETFAYFIGYITECIYKTLTKK